MNTPWKKRPGHACNGSLSKIDSGIYGLSTATSSMKGSLTSTTMTNTRGSSEYDGITLDMSQDERKEDDTDVDLFSSTLPQSLTLPTLNFNLSDLSILKDKNDREFECCRPSKDLKSASKEKTTPASAARKSSKYSQMKAELQRSIDRDFTFLSRHKPSLNESSYFKARSESLNNVSFGLKERINDENSSSHAEKKGPRSSIFQELDSIFDTSRYDVSAFRKKEKKQNKSILETSRASSFCSLAFDPVFNSTKLLTPIESDTSSCDTIGNVSSTSFNTTNSCCSCNKKKRETSCKSSRRKETASTPLAASKPASTTAATTTNVTTNLNTQGRELTITITVKLPE